ncbi:hypothetical protein BH23BAC1_BH23BAC1_07690 [soil metagenome]
MKNFGSILLLCFAFSIGNAQEVTVQSNHDQATDFNQYKTFTIVDRDDPNSQWNKGERSDMERTGTDASRQSTTGKAGGDKNKDKDRGTTQTQGTTDQHRNQDTQAQGTTQGQGTQGQGTQTQGTRDDERPAGTIGTTDGNRGVHTPEGPQGTGIQNRDQRTDDTNNQGATDQDRNQGTQQQGTQQQGTQGTRTGTEGAIDRESNQQQGQAQGQGQASGVNQGAAYGQGQASDARTGKSKHGTADMNKKEKLKKAFKSEMEKQGFTYVEGTEADLLVDFKIFEEEGTVNLGTPDNTYAAWGPHIGDRAGDVSINKGTVLVNMIDAEQGQLVYQAYVNMEGEGKKEEKMKEAVSELFEDFNTVRR